MPARTLKPRHQDDIRAKIQGSQLINVLQNHAIKGTKLNPSRITAAQILLRKILPDQTAIDASVDHVGKIVHETKVLK